MRRSSWIVKDDLCWHCNAPAGEEHNAGCPHRKRTIVAQVVFTFVEIVPEHWSALDYAQNRDHGRYCATNTVGILNKIVTNGNCFCDHVQHMMIGDATKQDEETFKVFLNEATH